MSETHNTTQPLILWFRKDLRLSAHPAWHQALQRKQPIIPVYIWSPTEENPWSYGEASRWWLHQSLQVLQENLQSVGSRLLFRAGPIVPNLLEIAKTAGASTVYWSRQYEPHLIKRDTAIKLDLQKSGVEVQTFNATLLIEPWELLNQTQKPYQVFTPYWKALQSRVQPLQTYRVPSEFRPVHTWPKSKTLTSLDILPKNNWHTKLKAHWQPGETQALQTLKKFLDNGVSDYKMGRDFPNRDSTAKISAHLHFGEISPAQIWDAAQKNLFFLKPAKNDTQDFLREIAWREFSYALMYHFPQTPTAPLQQKFLNFPWQNSKTLLQAWQTGQTGYPIVDAGMRELWQTGFMHNRVRMIVASFLTKDLFIDWQDGAKWFWDTLVDADLASNTQGWQWTAGCGADAAPYFRIFNPILQSEKFDPNGDYIKKWVPELAKLAKKWIHKPFLASAKDLTAANITLGKTYPYPIVEHARAREHALAIWQSLKK